MSDEHSDTNTDRDRDRDVEHPVLSSGPGRSVSRRRLLAAAGSATALAGCLGLGGGDGCGSEEITVEESDGTTTCVAPVESDRPVAEFYGFGRDLTHSASTPDELAVDDATVTFVHRQTGPGTHSLVTINGSARTTSDGGGRAVVTVRNAAGATWQVQDGPPGTGGGDRDPYTTADGAFGESESVLWGWNDDRTDGGAVGPLEGSYDLEVVHRAEGSVDGQTEVRSGLDRWLFVDGATPESPVELATFDDAGDVTVGVSGRGE